MSDNTPIIARTAMLAQLNISQWTGRKYDKHTTSELNRSKQAADDASRVNKLIMEKSHLEPIVKITGACRTEFDRLTLPWGSRGQRILPVAMYSELNEYLMNQTDQFHKKVEAFVTRYKELVETQRFRMGSFFNLNDYPRPAEIKNKFAISFHVYPIPTADDFRVQLSSTVEEQVRQQVERDLNDTTAEIVSHLWQQVGEMLVDIRDRLQDPQARFRRGLLDKFVQLIQDLDRLNITDDPKLKELRRDAQSHLMALRDPENLRNDKDSRKAVADDLDKLTKKFEGLWS